MASIGGTPPTVGPTTTIPNPSDNLYAATAFNVQSTTYNTCMSSNDHVDFYQDKYANEGMGNHIPLQDPQAPQRYFVAFPYLQIAGKAFTSLANSAPTSQSGIAVTAINLDSHVAIGMPAHLMALVRPSPSTVYATGSVATAPLFNSAFSIIPGGLITRIGLSHCWNDMALPATVTNTTVIPNGGEVCIIRNEWLPYKTINF